MDSISIDRTTKPSSGPAACADPFDFSDFGGRVSAGPARPGLQCAPEVPSGGFDPFEGQSPAATMSATMSAVQETFTGPESAARMSVLEVAGPPLRLFGTAFMAAVIGAVLGLSSFTGAQANPMALLAFIGWLLAGPVAIGVLARCSRVDTARRLSAVYSAPAWLRAAYWAVLTTCAAGIGIGAWQLALWAGTL